MRRGLFVGAMAGSASGLLVLGIGGRILMRLLAFTTPEDPRFTWLGTAQVVSIAAGWGFVTGPLIAVAPARLGGLLLAGPVHGLVAFTLAAVPFLLFSGFRGSLVAPTSFLWLGGITFPLLFAVHGTTVDLLWRRFRPAG